MTNGDVNLSVEKPPQDDFLSPINTGLNWNNDNTKDILAAHQKTHGLLSDLLESNESLRQDLATGKLNAVVYMDGQKLDAALGRRISYTGTLTS